MSLRHLVAIAVIGIVAGFLAGKIMKGRGFGLLGDLVVGIIGAFLGGWLFATLGIWVSGGVVASIVVSTIGALLLLFVIRLVKTA